MLRRAGRTGNQQIQIACGFASAAQRAGGSDSLNAGESQQIRGDAPSSVLGHVDTISSGAAAIFLDALAKFFNLLFSHAGQAGETAGVDGLGELVDAVDLSCGPEERNCLGAHPGQLEQFKES